MNREIKFRLWDGMSKTMFYLSNAEVYDNGLWFGFPNASDHNDDEKAVVMQFTGLLDKNGREIYEGDTTNYGTVKWFSALTWDGGGSRHPGFYFGNVGGDMEYHDGFFDDIEVLGNIYENPQIDAI